MNALPSTLPPAPSPDFDIEAFIRETGELPPLATILPMLDAPELVDPLVAEPGDVVASYEDGGLDDVGRHTLLRRGLVWGPSDCGRYVVASERDWSEALP